MNKRIILLALTIVTTTLSALAYTAQFHAGAGKVGGQSDFTQTEASDGAGIVLPTPVLDDCDMLWEFAGWITSSVPYEIHDELTQELYLAGTVYHLSSVSEEFYAVYRYITDRYCEIYVNDQLISGSQYVSVNTYQHGFMYPDADGLYARYVESNYNTWSNGYIDIDAPVSALDADTRAKLPHVITETNETEGYWSLYNPHTGYYIDIANLAGTASYNTNADCVIERNGWNTFTFRSAGSDSPIGLYIQTGTTWLIIPTYEWYTDFNIYRQQTIFTSYPDCNASNHTVTLDAGSKGSVDDDRITETGFHHGIVLPAATPKTGSSDCNTVWEFAGWTEKGATLNGASLPNRLWLAGEVYYPTRNETLHAIYRRLSTTWEQVEDPNTLQAGENILIAYEDGENYYVLSSAESATGYNSAVQKTASAITSIDDPALIWTLEGKKGAWRLKDANGKHLDMTRNDYAFSYAYPWSRWSDEFTIAGVEDDFTIRSNYAAKHYLTANSTQFSSAASPTGNIHIYRQVTTYASAPGCPEYTVLFNSGEGTFNGTKNATVIVSAISSTDGIRLSDSRVPVATPPQGCGWYFAGWSVGKGINATSNAPGVLYTDADTYVPTKDSIELFAVYQYGNGSVYYEQVTSKNDVTSDGTYVIVCNANNKAVTYNNRNTSWAGTTIETSGNRITSYVQPAMLWTYVKETFIGFTTNEYFYNIHDDEDHYLAYDGNTSYAGKVTNESSPFTLYYSHFSWGYHYYYLHWNGSSFTYDEDVYSNLLIYKQHSTVARYYSWPHCTPFSVILNACGGQFTSTGDTQTPVEEEAGEGINLTGHTPTTDCSTDGWTFVGWVERHPLQATTEAPAHMHGPASTYSPKQDADQLYAVYSNGRIWSSYPACGEGIEVVNWFEDGLIVETYLPQVGTPSVNGVAGTANADGTYTLPFDVEGNPCTPLHIQWGELSLIVKTPILVNQYTRVSALISEVGDCSDCDMVVAANGTAIVNRTPQTVRDITIYPGGRLTIEAEKTLNASSLTMRADGDQLMPSAHILGTLNCPVLYHDRRIDNDRYYWMALPYDVEIDAINYADADANGKRAVYDTDFYIKFYDGVRRAADNGRSGSYWTHIGDITDESYQPRTTLKAGRGYLIGLPYNAQNNTGHTSRTLRFPMAMTTANWTSEQNILKTVAAQGADAEWPQHIGWNLIGNPFLQNYSAVSSSDLVCGKLTENIDAQGNPVEPWLIIEEGTEDVPYITIYDPESDSYSQTRLIGHNIPPFSAAFVQLSDGKTGLQFNGTQMQAHANVIARKVGLLNADDTDKSEFDIAATTATGGTDRFTVILDNRRSTRYEIGADLMKMHNNGMTNIYAHHSGIECVFDALSYSDADSIPVGLTLPDAGEAIIALHRTHPADDIEHIWLIDNDQRIITDLMSATYSFTSEAGTYNNRLWIRVQMRDQVATDLTNQYGSGNQTRKMIRNGQLLIQRDRQIYNATGLRVQ